jgi:predicted O-linked N-acetylglucosamine transferase (SPINDLY family)
MFDWIKKRIPPRDPGARDPDPSAKQSGSLKLIKKEGDGYVRAGRYEEAERCYRVVVESDARHPGAIVGLGFVLREQGRNREARDVLERAVQIAADDADAHYLLATVLETAEPCDTEILHLKKAIQLRPDFELARRQLIAALCRWGRIAEATEICEASLALLPASAELHLYRSDLYLHAGEKERAIASCERALALNPLLLPARQNLSRLLLETDQLDAAEVSYRREIEITPEHFGPRHQLGLVLHRLGRHAEAIEQYTGAIALNPNSSGSYSSLAAAYLDFDDTSEKYLALAHQNYEKAVALEPGNPDFHYNLAFSHWRGARLDLALASFDRAIDLDAGHVKARWARVMLWAPAFAPKSGDDSPDRRGFEAELGKFEDWWAGSATDGSEFVGNLQPFFLAYQEECNLALLRRYGQVCARAMQRWLEGQKAPAFQRPPGRRIRLGVVSGDIRVHSIWMALIQGWMLSLDCERFELVVFSLSAQADAQTAWARTKADVFMAGPKSLSHWVAAIREQNCEILLYPAVGLDPMTLKLASLRLAPVQINSWGHPDTSGLPTLDYYLSADCFEPADGQEHYSERLVLLPHLGNRVQPLALPDSDPDLAAMNIDPTRPILVCPGTPYKYQPVNDHVLVEIAQRVPNAQLVFFRSQNPDLFNVLQTRITTAFETAGLDVANHVCFIRWLSFPEFHSLLRRADLMLDTIGFSGYNTAVQAIECGLPFVTREGRFLRGRLASAVLRRMDLTELIAETKDEYVNLAVRLIIDRPYQGRIRQEIEQRRPVLFDDQSAMEPLHAFLESVARPA